MKNFLLVAFLAVSSLAAAKGGDTPEYIRQYSPLAVSEMNRSGIPASITMAQAILESASGTSYLAVNANNHFGIKCGKSWDGETAKYDDDKRHECFRVYPSVEQSWTDHSDFLTTGPRYSALFRLERSDYRSWARGLSECGYATDKKYATKLINLIEEYRLYQLDGGICPSGDTATEDVVIAEPSYGSGETLYDESVPVIMERQVMLEDGRPYVIAAEGETYVSIARRYGLFKSEILRFNEVSGDTVPTPGTKVYLKKSPVRK